MKFREAAKRISDGDLCFFGGVKPHSRIIKMRSLSRFSHVGLFFWAVHALERRLYVVESVEPYGVRIYPFAKYLAECEADGCAVDWYQLLPRHIDVSHAVRHCLDRVGNRYADPRQFIRSFLWTGDMIRRLFGLPVDTNRGRYFCSELIAEAYMAAGFKATNGIPSHPAQTTPGDVAHYPCLVRQGRLEL